MDQSDMQWILKMDHRFNNSSVNEALHFFFNHQKKIHVQKLPKAKSLGLNSFYVVLFFMSINCNKVIIDFSDYKVQKCRYWAYSTHVCFFWQKKLFSIFLAVVFKSASIIDKFPYNLITHLPLFFLIFLNSIFMINLKVLKFKYNVL